MEFRKNSLTRYIDEYSVATRVKQLRSEYKRLFPQPISIVIVEGDIDQLIFKSLFAGDKAHVEIGFGKPTTIKAVTILVNDHFEGVLGIVDDDFDSLNGKRIKNDNIIPIDAHDIEALIISSPSLDKFLLTLLPGDKRRFLSRLVDETRSKLIEICFPLGLIRWITSDHKVNFENININYILTKNPLQIDKKLLVEEILLKNPDYPKSEKELLTLLNEAIQKRSDEWRFVCQGHDLIKTLLLIIPLLLTPYAPTSRKDKDDFYKRLNYYIGDSKQLSKYLFLAYEAEYFKTMKAFGELKSWEEENQPYELFIH